MQELTAPTYIDAEKLVRMYWSTTPGFAKTAKRFETGTDGTTMRDRTPVDMDIEFKFELEEYMEAKKDNKKLWVAWKEINGKIYNLLLLHSAPDVVIELQSNANWDAAEAASDVIMLLEMLRNITHNLKESKQGVMVLVECHVDMTCTHQKLDEPLEEYYRIFMARVATVNAHDGNAGFHKLMYEKHLLALMIKKGINATTLATLTPPTGSVKRKNFKTRPWRAATRSSSPTYFC